MKIIKKVFGGLELGWGKLILFAAIAGIYTGVMAALPFVMHTSFRDIAISFEWWVLFGVIIILNSKSPLDAGLKCFVFFLISQPLVYLVQVLFFGGGWELMGYYRNWILWTILTFPMGFIGHFLKKGKWWGLLILTPITVLLADHYAGFLSETINWFPHHLLSAIFCVVTMLVYPLAVFDNKTLRRVGVIIAAVIIAASSVYGVISAKTHGFYNTTLLAGGEKGEPNYFDDSYEAALADESFGKVYIVYNDDINCYMVNAEFKKPGDTELVMTSPDGKKEVYTLSISKDTYELNKKE